MTAEQRIRLTVSLAVFSILTIAFTVYVMSPAEPRQDIAQVWGYQPTPVYGDITVSQRFVSQSDDLSAIGVQFGLYRPISTGVEFSLYEVGSGTVLKQRVRQKAGSDRIVNGADTVFSFPPIADSGGRSYVFTIEAPDSDREHAVAVFLTGGERYDKPYKTTETLFENKETGRDMNFITYAERSNKDILGVYLTSSGRFVHAGGAVAFYLVIMSLFAASGWLIGLLSMNMTKGDKA